MSPYRNPGDRPNYPESAMLPSKDVEARERIPSLEAHLEERRRSAAQRVLEDIMSGFDEPFRDGKFREADAYPLGDRRGRSVYRVLHEYGADGAICDWQVDHAMPLIQEDRDHVERWLAVEEEDCA